MLLTIYAKKRTTNDGGRVFYNYLSSLTKKDGTVLKVQVKFTEDAGSPKGETCPTNIEVNKEDCNLSTRTYTDAEGETHEAPVLWVSKWSKSAVEFEDHSMDDFV